MYDLVLFNVICYFPNGHFHDLGNPVGRICINMVVDLKVLVRSFNCESRACYVGNPRESFFRVRESKILFRESFAKVGYSNHYVKGCHPLPPRVRQEKGTRECE